MNDLLTIEDAAKQLRVSPRTVRRLVDKRHIRCVYVGVDGQRRMRFTQAHIDEFVQARSVAP